VIRWALLAAPLASRWLDDDALARPQLADHLYGVLGSARHIADGGAALVKTSSNRAGRPQHAFGPFILRRSPPDLAARGPKTRRRAGDQQDRWRRAEGHGSAGERRSGSGAPTRA